jgi:hypothetical protein
MDYEQWTRSEIARLRSEAEKALAEAATLQRAFDKWLELQGRQNESRPQIKYEETHGPNGHTPQKRGRRAGYGSKNATALEKIKTSPNGLTIDELYSIFADMYGTKYKRSSLRALLWNQKKLGNIDNNNGRYVITHEESSA